MSNPPIQYSGPKVSEEVPWETRQHLQQIYQKLANHTQAFSLQQQAIGKLKPGSTTTIVEGGGGAAVPISLGGVNNQTGVTAYTTTQGDNGVVLLLNDASPVAVTLNSAVDQPFYINVTNFGAGLVTLTPTTGNIDGGATFTVPQNGLTVVVWDGTNWWASAISAPTGLSVTITTAQLTPLGAQGSMTFVSGVLTAQTPAT